MKTDRLLSKIKIIFTIGLMGIFCFANMLYAQFASDTLVNDDGSEFEQILPDGTPSIAIYENIVYSTWLDARAGATTSNTMGYDVYFAKGTVDSLGKVIFGTNIRVNDTNQSVYPGDTATPSIAVASDGTIFIVWKDSREATGLAGSEGNSIYLARSVDGGTSFLANQKIDILPSTETYRHRRSPRVTAADGYVYVIFGKGMTQALEMSISSDNGVTFSNATDILPVPADESIIAADGSYLYVASVLTTSQGVGLPSRSDVMLYISSDHGQTFGSSITINDDGMDKRPQDVAMAASSDNLYLVWRDDRNVTAGVPGGYYVYGAISHDRGLTFGSNMLISPDVSSITNSSDDNRYFPAVSASGDNVAISSHGVLGTYKSVIARVSNDKGTTWTSEMMVSDIFSRPDIGPSSIAVNASTACVLWQADGEYVEDTGTGNNIYASGYVFGTPSSGCPSDVTEFNVITSTLTLRSVCIDGVYYNDEVNLILDFTTGTFQIE